MQFSRLIGNDLAVFEWHEDTVNLMKHIGYRVSLSRKGEHLIEAWMKGDRKDVAEALSPGPPSEPSPALS